MPLNNYQITFNGLTIGSGSSVYLITNIDGLGGTSPLRIQDDNRGYIDGSYSGRDFYDERQVFIDVTVLGDNTNTAQYYYKQLQKAFAPQQLGFYVDPTGNTPASNQLQLFQYQLTADTGTMRMYGRSRGLVTPVDPDFSYGYIKTRIQMTFPDPRYYDDAGTTKTGASFTLTNTGWAISCPVITIASTSGASGSITDGTTTMTFANMSAGQQLIVDLLSRVIYYNGYPARNYLTSNYSGWLSIAPNTLPASPVTWTSTVGSMSVTYRNAYV